MNSRLLPWLTHQQSLTEKLFAEAGDARLELLNQQDELVNLWDQQQLKLDASIQVTHREIIMWAHDHCCWYARTIIPNSTKEEHTRLFDQLKTQPLGHLIFNNADITRQSYHFYEIDSYSAEYKWLNESMHQGESPLWVRLSEFRIKRQDQFFLVEILLPGLMRVIN